MKTTLKSISTVFLLLFLSGLMFAVSAAGTDGDFYVSPTGNDANNGSIDAPFKTIANARDAVRAKKAGGMNNDMIVYLRGGEYTQTETIRFNNEDSGVDGKKIRYVAYPGETPLITSAQHFTGFQLHDSGKNIYKISVPAGTMFRQLYVDGAMAVRSRYPNKAPELFNCFDAVTVNQAAGTLGIPAKAIAPGGFANQNTPNNYVEVVLNQEFALSYIRIKDIIPSGDMATISFREREEQLLKGFTAYPKFRPDLHFYHLENAYELIDADHEWFLDITQNVLYYKAPQGVDINTLDITAPTLEELVEIKGSTPLDRVKNIEFYGITFADANYLTPSREGFIDGQANQDVYATIPPDAGLAYRNRTSRHPVSAIAVNNAEYILFEENTFTRLGIQALDFHEAVHHNTVKKNIFHHNPGNAVMFGVFTPDETAGESPYPDVATTGRGATYNEITDNYFHHNSSVHQGGVAIAVGYAANTVVEHNEVYDMPYTGISVGWGWTKEVTLLRTNKINANHVHQTGQTMNDGAGIYTLSEQQPNSEIKNNLIEDTYRYWVPIRFNSFYLDEQSNGFTVQGNTMINANEGITYNGTAPVGHPSNKRADIVNQVINEDGKTIILKDKAGTEFICPDPQNIDRVATIYGAGVRPGNFDIDRSHSVLPVDVKVAPGEDIKLKPIGMTGYKIWVAPINTTLFASGANMTMLDNTFTGDMVAESAGFTPSIIKAPAKPGTYKVYVQDDNGKFSQASVSSITVGTTPDSSDKISADAQGKYILTLDKCLVSSYKLVDGTTDYVRFWSNQTTGTMSWKINLAKSAAFSVQLKYRAMESVSGKVELIDNQGVVVKSAALSQLFASNEFTTGGSALLMAYGIAPGEYIVKLSGLKVGSQNLVGEIAEAYLEETTPDFQLVSEPMKAIDATPTAATGKTPPSIVIPKDGNPPYITNITSGAGAGAGAFWYANLDKQKVYDITVNYSRPTIAGSGDTKLVLNVYTMEGVLLKQTSTSTTVKPEPGLWFGPTTTSTADKDAPWVDQYCGTIDLSSLPLGNYKFELVRVESSNGRMHVRYLQLSPQMPLLENITAETTKTQYIAGQSLDHSTITVTANYTGESYVLTEAEYQTAYDFTLPGTQTVTFSYKDKTATLDVEVIAKIVEKIEITSPAILNNYNVGDTEVDFAEMVVMATYNDGDIQQVPNEDLEATFDFSKEGQAEVVISYGGKSTSYFVNVTNGTGINDAKNDSAQISIFPNPSKGNAVISISGINEKIAINIYDNSGRLLKKIDNVTVSEKTEVPVILTNQGNYFVRIQGENWSETKKMVVVK